MARKRDKDYDKIHRKNIEGYARRVRRIYHETIAKATQLAVLVRLTADSPPLRFSNHPLLKKKMDELIGQLATDIEAVVLNGIESEWTLANNKNNVLAQRVFGKNIGKLSPEQARRYFSTNDAARKAFAQRRQQGLNLSDRIWKSSQQFRNELEMSLDLGIRNGHSAQRIARDIRQYLNEPDKLFRRVRDEHGQLHLSKAAKAYHPGRGVCRSSFKNAARVARNETNMAYRKADHLRWQNMDFVVGQEIRLSEKHTVEDMCDELKGIYPKDFVFSLWHTDCNCYAISVLKTPEEMRADTQRILNGMPVDGESESRVRDVPPQFKEWISKNADRIERAQERDKLPYFIRDNEKYV